MPQRRSKEINEKRIHRWFLASVWLKGINAALECMGALILWLVPVTGLVGIAQALTAGELIEDPNDLVATALRNWAASLSVSSAHFYAAYLLIHGVVKIALVAGLLRNKLWAYPTSLAVLGAFIVYQLYRLTHAFSLGLILLTVFDFVVVGLIWQEYRAARKRSAGGLRT